jgi:hypothetical protein
MIASKVARNAVAVVSEPATLPSFSVCLSRGNGIGSSAHTMILIFPFPLGLGLDLALGKSQAYRVSGAQTNSVDRG